MANVYTQRDKFRPAFDPTRCKAAVHDTGRLAVGFHQCRRKPKRDGWCGQHHPEAEERRSREQKERWAREAERDAARRVSRALREATVEQLREELARREEQS